MAELKVYHYPKCSTCRNARKFLDASGVDYDEYDIVKTPPTVEELQQMLKYFEGNIKKLFNTSGNLYKELALKDKLPEMTEQEALELLSQNGMLVKRPFAFTSEKGAVGFKSPDWERFI